MPQWVFWNDDAGHRCDLFTTRWIKKAAEAAGLPGSWSPHRLRSSCATLLNEADVPSFVIMGILRHKNIQTTLRYAKTDEKMKLNGLMRLEAMTEKGGSNSEVDLNTSASSMPMSPTQNSAPDLDILRAMLPPGMYEKVAQPLLGIGLSEMEALAVAFRHSLKHGPEE